MKDKPFYIQLDWNAGAEHLPLLFIKNIHKNRRNSKAKTFYTELGIDTKLDIDFDIEIKTGSGSPESLRELVHGNCDLALSGAITFAEHYEIENHNVMSVGLLIRKPPISILGEANDKEKITITTSKVEDKLLAELLNSTKTGVLPSSAPRDWFRYFVKKHNIKPSIVEIPSAREFGSNIFHDVPLLVCYEYNQALEILCRYKASRFFEIFLRDDNTSLGLPGLKSAQLISSTSHIQYAMMPGVAFIACCTKWYADDREAKIFKNRLKKLLRSVGVIIKRIKQLNSIQIRHLADKISKESEGIYICEPSRTFYRKWSLLRQKYWVNSVRDGNNDDGWTQVYNLCDFSIHNIREATEGETGLFYNPLINGNI